MKVRRKQSNQTRTRQLSKRKSMRKCKNNKRKQTRHRKKGGRNKTKKNRKRIKGGANATNGYDHTVLFDVFIETTTEGDNIKITLKDTTTNSTEMITVPSSSLNDYKRNLIDLWSESEDNLKINGNYVLGTSNPLSNDSSPLSNDSSYLFKETIIFPKTYYKNIYFENMNFKTLSFNSDNFEKLHLENCLIESMDSVKVRELYIKNCKNLTTTGRVELILSETPIQKFHIENCISLTNTPEFDTTVIPTNFYIEHLHLEKINITPIRLFGVSLIELPVKNIHLDCICNDENNETSVKLMNHFSILDTYITNKNTDNIPNTITEIIKYKDFNCFFTQLSVKAKFKLDTIETITIKNESIIGSLTIGDKSTQLNHITKICIEGLKHLIELKLFNIGNDDHSILKNLINLKIKHCPMLTKYQSHQKPNEGNDEHNHIWFNHLKVLNNLVTLDLTGTLIHGETNGILTEISNITSLKILILDDCLAITDITSLVPNQVEGANDPIESSITHLSIARVPLTIKNEAASKFYALMIDNIPNLTNLEYLNMEGTSGLTKEECVTSPPAASNASTAAAAVNKYTYERIESKFSKLKEIQLYSGDCKDVSIQEMQTIFNLDTITLDKIIKIVTHISSFDEL